MSMDLRPLALGELLDRAFTLYRRHFRLFVGVMAVPSVLALALAILVQIFQRGTNNALAAGAVGTGAPLPSPAVILSFFAGIIIVMFAYLGVYMVALGATTLAVSEISLGRTATIADAYSRMRGRVGRLILLMLYVSLRMGAVIVAGTIVMTLLTVMIGVVVASSGGTAASGMAAVLAVLLVFGSMVVLGGVMIFMMMRYSVSVPALVLENLGAGAAIRRSVALTKGNLGRVFLLGLLAFVISAAGTALFQGPFMIGVFMAGPETIRAFWLNIAGSVSGVIGGTLIAPILVIGLALLYYDTRIRHEGLDLELMIAALDQKGQPSAPAQM
jgi:hypothetical protein